MATPDTAPDNVPDNQTDSPGESYPVHQVPSQVQQRILTHFQGDWVKRLNVEQMFTLINTVLPLEACLYYQVLPLFLDGTRLHLGMVMPNDTAALEYVRRIVSYLNYSLVPRAITYNALQSALTGYLNYTGNQSVEKIKRQTFSYGHHRHSAQVQPEQMDPSNRPTLIVDSPEDLNEYSPSTPPQSVAPPPLMPASPAPPPPPSVKPPDEPDWLAAVSEMPLENRIEPSSAAPGASPSLPEAAPPPQTLPPLINQLPALRLEARYLGSPIESLEALPAEDLLQELLTRVLVGGIGRLYFECHPQYGRVLWSQDGILQSVLEQLPLFVFHQLLNELKQLANLPPQPIQHPQQVDIERLYNRSRILLRFRFMQGQYGEEATLQVLRGAALRFYQQQQITRLKRDALGIAKQLQHKLNEIRDRAYAEPGLAAARFDALPALNQLLQKLEEQIDPDGDEKS